jgi:hypothetical protein
MYKHTHVPDVDGAGLLGVEKQVRQVDGGTAGRLSPSDRVLLGRPDVLIIGVGGGAKVYDGTEAAEVVRELSPRRVIPVQYTTGKVPPGCDQGSVEPFLKAMAGTPVKRGGTSLNLPGKLSDGLVIEVLR